MTFWLAASGLLLLVILAVGWAALGAPRRRTDDVDARLYRQRLAELAEDVDSGVLDRAAVDGLAAEIGRATLTVRRAPGGHPARTGSSQRNLAILLTALLVPAIAVPVYLHIGRPDLAIHGEPAATEPEHLSVDEMTRQLQARAAAEPANPEPRQWLARVYMATEQYGKAADEFATLHKILGDAPSLLLQWADALAMLNEGRLAGRPAELVAQALAAEPDNITALWLSGLAAEEAGDRARALGHLKRAREASATAHQPTDELDAAIANLEGATTTLDGPAAATDAAMDAAPATATTAVSATARVDDAAPTTTASPAAAARIEVQIDVAPELAGKVAPDATLFVVARAPQGPPMPLAVKRLPASALPVTVTLDDSLAMAPGMNLSSVREVLLVARVSRSGQAMPQAGDLQGTAGPISVREATESIGITISEVVP